MHRSLAKPWVLWLLTAASAIPAEQGIRQPIVLDGAWEISTDGGNTWKQVSIPGTFESQVAVDFDGMAVFRKQIEPRPVGELERLILHFDAVATECTVWFNGQQIGQHLGGWTPFRFDVTDGARSRPDGPWEIRVEVDEKVGHNTQGFLPVIAPHFGGIWQGVRLLTAPEVAIDPLRLRVVGNSSSGSVEFEIPFTEQRGFDQDRLEIRIRENGAQQWLSSQHVFLRERDGGMAAYDGQTVIVENGVARFDIPLQTYDDAVSNWRAVTPKLWSGAGPQLYDFTIDLFQPGGVAQQVIGRFAFRDVRTDEEKLLLNGGPLVVRGLLNWGYAPPGTAPSLDEAFMRREIEFARSRGFNLMKFCLWIPPKRYLELCDELGMLAWIEYPTWHANLDQEHQAELLREYDEFFHYDRNHPSVILRSLTCETGPSADLDVVRSLYDLCKNRIPGAIVEDDSSWIGWNRIHDFYDDHPYGNNRTWVATLERLQQYIAERQVKPLILGEAIAADTWFDVQLLEARDREARPFWWPGFAEGNQAWMQTMSRFLRGLADRIKSDSRRYAMLMRKYQIETYRREVPFGGYVVSVIRDFPLAGMGLIDYLGKPKWSARDWAWHGEAMLLLRTEDDRRSFESGTDIDLEVLLSHFGAEQIAGSQLHIDLVRDDGLVVDAAIADLDSIGPATLRAVFSGPLRAPFCQQPSRYLVRAKLIGNQRTITNEWPIWICPTPQWPDRHNLIAHHSFELEPGTYGIPGTLDWKDEAAETVTGQVVFARQLDQALLDYVQMGNNIVLLPDNQRGSFPTRDHWFLRGGPVVATDRRLPDVPVELISDLQHFDLAGPVVPEIDGYLGSIEPLITLWDNHDLDHVRTHGVLFAIRFGGGRGTIVISTLDHASAAGKWMLSEIVTMLHGEDPFLHSQPRQFNQMLLDRLLEDLHARQIDLRSEHWRFRSDKEGTGAKKGWHISDLDDSDWVDIQIGAHWEGQGHEALDGWAWYRVKVQVPGDWDSRQTFLNFDGADDYYRLYIDGELVGTGGDLEQRQTAFDEKKSHDVSRFVTPGKAITIAVAVYDWQGAGGLFRPITLSTQSITGQPRMLK